MGDDTDIAGLVTQLRYRDGEVALALKIADIVLDRPYGDPDDDSAVLARHLTRAFEKLDQAVAALERLQAEKDGLLAEFHRMTAAWRKASVDADMQDERREAAEAERDGQWRDIATAPKNKKVLVAYRNALGKWRIVTACYHTQLPWSDEEAGLHEAEYAPEGWYEESDSSETIYRTSSPPTHWRHLPAPPSPGVQHD